MPRFEEGTGFLIPDPVPPLLLSHLEFLDRFPAGSDSVITDLAWGDTPLAATVRAVLLRFQIAGGIDPADPRTEVDANGVAQLLAFAGHITPEQIPAVVAAVLAPVPDVA